MTGTPYGAEWTLLEGICTSLAQGEDDGDTIREALARPAFSWGVLLEHAVVHKLQALLADRLMQERVQPLVPRWMRMHLSEVRAFNAHRLRVTGKQASAIVRHAADAGVPLAVRKGIVFDQTLFEGRAIRVFCDLDLMVRLSDQDRLVEVLAALGYQQGGHDLGSGIRPLERKELVRHRLNPDHFPRMVAPTGDTLLPYVEVDCATSLTWTTSEYQFSLDPAFTSLDQVQPPSCSVGIPILPPRYQLLDGVLHLFREAFVESTLRDGLPVKLAAFLDVALLWRRYESRVGGAAWGAELVRAGLGAPVAWVLGHTDRLFGTNIVGKIGLAGLANPLAPEAWRKAGGDPGYWPGDMRRRLFHGGVIYDPAAQLQDPMEVRVNVLQGGH